MKTASGSGLGFGTPLTKRSMSGPFRFLPAMTWAFPKWTCSGVSEMHGGLHCTSGRTSTERLGLALIPEPSGKRFKVLN